MTHFAKIDNLATVIFVTVGNDGDKELELCLRTGDTYRETSYNTRGGVHYDSNTGEQSADQSKAFRKNFAGIGYTFDTGRNAFIPSKPFPSWTLDEATCLWESPKPYPDTATSQRWNEGTKAWDEIV